MSDELKTKHEALLKMLRDMGSAAVAFSGGVDSSYLLHAAHEALGDRAVGLIASEAIYSRREHESALSFAAERGIHLVLLRTHMLDEQSFRDNPPDRCYHCKHMIFSEAWRVARDEGCEHLLDGGNADDLGDFRPGMQAVKELGVRSPLLELGFGKKEIRGISQLLNLPTWRLPSMACLASRIPYGEEINEEKLARIESSEEFLRKLGFEQVRLRDHGDVARIEVGADELGRFGDADLRERVLTGIREAGYKYVCLDLQGYRLGAMNEVLGD